MARKREEKKGEEGKSKELKIVTVQVVTPEKVMQNKRQMGLLYLIDALGPLHERTLTEVTYILQDKGLDLVYDFRKVGNNIYSQSLKNDLVTLMYVGFLETEPGLYRKLRTTSQGKAALEKSGAPQGIVEFVKVHFEELRNRVSLVDAEIDKEIRDRLRLVSRPRRRQGF